MTSVYYSSFEPSEDSGAKGTAAFASVTAASLTVPSSVVPTLADGTGGVYSSSGGFMVVKRSDEVLAATYSVVSRTPSSPTWISINASTGAYTVTDPLTDSASAVLRATVDGTNYDLTYTLAKVKKGVDGAVGSSNAIVYLYQRAATQPAAPSGTFTYTFATGVLSGGTPGSWTQAIPANNGQPLWVIAATASATTATDTIAANEFSSPVVLAQDGTNGTNGLNSATVFLYQRAATAPAVPNANTTYTFATGLLSGAAIGSWTQTVPAGTDPLYVTTATAVATTATDTIANTEWATVRVLAQNGSNGSPGTAAVSGYLTSESVSVFAYANGVVTSYAPATGSFVILSGTTDISTNFTLSTVTNPQTLTVTYTNRVYTVSAGFDANEDTASLTIRATGSGAWAGITVDKVFSLAKTKGGYEIVSSLPGSGDPRRFEGSIVFLTTDDKLYRFEGTNWTAAVPAVDITGQILNAQIADNAVTEGKIVNSAIISAKLADSAVTSGKLANLAVTSDKLVDNAVISAKLADLAVTSGKLVDNAVTSAKLVDNAVVSAKLADSAVTSGKIGAGAVSSAKLAIGVGGNMLIGAVPSTNPNKWNIAGYNPDSVTYRNNGFGIFLSYTYGGAAGNEWTLSDNSTFAIYQDNAFSGGAGLADFYPSTLSSVSGSVNYYFPVVVNKTYEFSVFTGAHRCKFGLFMGWVNSSGNFISFTTEDVNDEAQLGGTTLSGYKRLISRGTAPAGAVSVQLIYRKYHTKPGQSDSWVFLNRPMFGETVANATEALPYSLPSPGIIHAEQLINSSIASGQIAANAIISDKIAANAIVSDKIAANAVTAGKIAADSITANEIAANAITANEIATNAITAGKIEANAVTADKVAANAITAAKISAGAITATKLTLTNGSAVDPDPNFFDPFWWGWGDDAQFVETTASNSSQPYRYTFVGNGGGVRDYSSENVPVEKGAWFRTRLRIYISPDAAGWIAPTWHWPGQFYNTPAPYTTRADVDNNAFPVIDMANTVIPKGQWVTYVNTREFNNTVNGEHFIEHRWRSNLTAGYVEFVWEVVRANNAELIVDGAITATKVAANAITADKIEANAVTADKIIANAIVSDKIAANAIIAGKIATNAITADKIEAGAVTAAKISVTSLSAITADVGTLTAGIIRNTSDSYRVDVTNGRTIVQTGSFMKVSGAPFGSSNQFIEWYGPYFASLSSCTEANATYYLKTNGSAYFGGTLSAGVLKNAAQSTSVASDASITVGDFSSNGGVKTITLSYEYARGYQCNTNTGAITGSSNIAVLIEKSINGGSTWTTLATLTVPDTERTVEVEPPDFDRVQYRASASTTLTDNTGAGNMRLRARLTSRTLPTLSGTGIFNFVETQNISVISIE